MTPTTVAGLPLMRKPLPMMSGVAAEIALPDAVADDGDLASARRVVGGGEIAPHHRRDAEDPEEVLGHVRAGVPLGMAVDRDVDRRAVQIRGERVERLLLRQQVLEVHRRDLTVHAEERGARRIDEVQADQAVTVRKRKPPQHHAVDDAEHRGHAGNAEREDDHSQRAEPLLFDEDAQTNLDVAQ